MLTVFNLKYLSVCTDPVEKEMFDFLPRMSLVFSTLNWIFKRFPIKNPQSSVELMVSQHWWVCKNLVIHLLSLKRNRTNEQSSLQCWDGSDLIKTSTKMRKVWWGIWCFCWWSECFTFLFCGVYSTASTNTQSPARLQNDQGWSCGSNDVTANLLTSRIIGWQKAAVYRPIESQSSGHSPSAGVLLLKRSNCNLYWSKTK